MSQFHRHFPELAADLDPVPSVSVVRPDRDAPGEDIPWHTDKDVRLAVDRIRNYVARTTVRTGAPFNAYDRRARDMRDLMLRAGGEHLLADLARVALGMKPTRELP